jgi:hypothetical protein
LFEVEIDKKEQPAPILVQAVNLYPIMDLVLVSGQD